MSLESKSGFPTVRLTSIRCGHSTSTGPTARNSGPGKSPLRPIPDCSRASSAAISASRSVRPVDEDGSTATKSTVPAIVDLRPSIGKRVTVRMPDTPAVSFAQLSVLPAPSDVTTPIPVTTTIGLPNLSRGAVMISPPVPRSNLLHGLDQGHAFALPMTGPDDHNLGRRLGYFKFQPGRVVGRKQPAARDRKCRKRKAQRKLRLQRVSEHGPGCAHRTAAVLVQKGLFFRRDGLDAGRAGDQAANIAGYAKFRPQRFQ